MKKIVIAAAIIAAGAGAYWYTQHGSSSSASANPLLDYIPADTPVFTGQLKPFPLKNYLQSISSNYQQYSTDSLAQLGDLDSPMAKFFVSIYMLTKGSFFATRDQNHYMHRLLLNSLHSSQPIKLAELH